MARKEILITLEDNKNNLQFRITQMSARRLEKWIVKAVLALAGVVQLPAGTDLAGAAKIISSNFFSNIQGIEFEKILELSDDLLECCEVRVDNAFIALTEDVIDGKIESVKTLFNLKKEALKLNLSFLDFASLSAIPGA